MRGKIPCLQSVSHQVDVGCLLSDVNVGRWMGDGNEAAKPVTAVLVCLSTFVGLKLLDDFSERPSSRVCGDKNSLVCQNMMFSES